jgi:hypothetical protein
MGITIFWRRSAYLSDCPEFRARADCPRMRPATDTANFHRFYQLYLKTQVNSRVCVMVYHVDLPPGSSGLEISKATSDVRSIVQMSDWLYALV